MEYRLLPYGTTGLASANAIYYDDLGVTKHGSLKPKRYDILVEVDGWYGIRNSTGEFVRFARKNVFSDVKVTRQDYNAFMADMIDDVLKRVTEKVQK